MSSPKYIQNHSMDDPPLHFYRPSSFPTRADASGSFDEVPSGMFLGSFAVCVYSSKPYDEFYSSMVEMVISKLDQDLTIDLEYMEELLLSYLKLNEKKAHKHILKAFLDVIEVLKVE
ncbi:hypothetical protein ABFS82_01G024700 [Erythranthe guttata]